MIEREKGLKAKFEHNMRKKLKCITKNLKNVRKTAVFMEGSTKKQILNIAKKMLYEKFFFIFLFSPGFSTSQK